MVHQLRTQSRLVTVLLTALLPGCAARKPVVKIIVPHDCIISLSVGPATECTLADPTHVKCTKVVIVSRSDCQQLQIIPKEKSK
jgi:hypothetical protein